jgi:hypothetical protein
VHDVLWAEVAPTGWYHKQSHDGPDPCRPTLVPNWQGSSTSEWHIAVGMACPKTRRLTPEELGALVDRLCVPKKDEDNLPPRPHVRRTGLAVGLGGRVWTSSALGGRLQVPQGSLHPP